MSHIEVLICLLLLFMVVPDLCAKLGRPALIYAVFVLFGIALGRLADSAVSIMLDGAGKVGFLLLLFEVGLEIELPRFKDFLAALKVALPWTVIQYPIVFGIGHLAGLTLPESLVAAAALTGCSVGMAHAAWKQQPDWDDTSRTRALQIMVTLEMVAIVLLALETTAFNQGTNFLLLAKLAGIGTVVFLVGRFAAHLKRLFQTVLEKATHWRTHLLVLSVLAICAIGDRLGLSSAKTAFFLGLFMSRAEHDGKGLEEYMAPVSQRFLIPVFFVSLGMSLPWTMLASWTALLAFGATGLLLGVRYILHNRWPVLGAGRNTFLILCPNLTVVALGATAILERTPDRESAASWLLLTGLFITVLSLFLLPPTTVKKSKQP